MLSVAGCRKPRTPNSTIILPTALDSRQRKWWRVLLGPPSSHCGRIGGSVVTFTSQWGRETHYHSKSCSSASGSPQCSLGSTCYFDFWSPLWPQVLESRVHYAYETNRKQPHKHDTKKGTAERWIFMAFKHAVRIRIFLHRDMPDHYIGSCPEMDLWEPPWHYITWSYRHTRRHIMFPKSSQSARHSHQQS